MKILTLAILMVFASFTAHAADGVINLQSEFSVDETTARLVKTLKKKGMTIFNQVKHSQASKKVGIPLRETELVIFGNPKVGSLLMNCQQSIAIDLPLKALIWKDENNKTVISYNDINFLVKRHKLEGCEKVVMKVKTALKNIMGQAAQN
jgi:uncharacterized protein (DUF302 family)